MSYLEFVVLVVPAAIGLVTAWWLGTYRGLVLGAVAALAIILVLLLFQVTLPEAGRAGAEASRFDLAYGLMRFEWARWVPSFLVGSALGSFIHGNRRRGA